MNYELAKKLKDAGFPYANKSPRIMMYPNLPSTLGGVEIPTLSELIEACGDGYFHLEHLQDGCIAWMGLDFDTSPTGKGRTPEEAVANLWLALHK